jgi:hypothetical protein
VWALFPDNIVIKKEFIRFEEYLMKEKKIIFQKKKLQNETQRIEESGFVFVGINDILGTR